MKYLKIFTDFREAMATLNLEEKGRLFDALLLYAETGETSELTGNEQHLWVAARQHLDREAAYCEQMREIGRRGGRPPKKKTLENPPKPSETQKDNDNDKDNDKDKDIFTPPLAGASAGERRYGSYGLVRLTEEQHKALAAEFTDLDERIRRLDEYMASTGKTYRNHAATIRSWARQERQEAQQKQEKPRRAKPSPSRNRAAGAAAPPDNSWMRAYIRAEKGAGA